MRIGSIAQGKEAPPQLSVQWDLPNEKHRTPRRGVGKQHGFRPTMELPARSIAAWCAAWMLLCLGRAAPLIAQAPRVHYMHNGAMPPGAIGSAQLERGGPLPGYFQPVEIRIPPGATLSMAAQGQFQSPTTGPVTAGLLIGSVYRLRIGQIAFNEGYEVFPTIEVIDRTYPRPEETWRFPIPIEIAQQDLQLALRGKFVTRVIYLEEPRGALPHAETPVEQEWFDVRPGENPLLVADTLGRPVAILRLGGRLPVSSGEPDGSFLMNCPQFLRFFRPPSPPPLSASARAGLRESQPPAANYAEQARR